MKNDSLVTTPASLQEVLDLITAIRPAARRADFPSITDLEEIFRSPGIGADARLWRDPSGLPAAYALVHFPYNNLNFEIREAWWTDELEDEILEWAQGRMRARYGEELAGNTLDGSCRAEDGRMARFFERHGFVKEEVESMVFQAELSTPPPDALLPEGFTIRALDPAGEVEQALAVHQAAYGTSNFTLEDRLAMMNTAAYRPALDLVAVAPDGTLAGSCVCGVEGAYALDGVVEGYTDPVVVLPRYQGKGLATALLMSGLVGLYALYARRVQLSTSSTNIGMQRAAEAAGFTCVARSAWFSLDLPE